MQKLGIAATDDGLSSDGLFRSTAKNSQNKRAFNLDFYFCLKKDRFTINLRREIRNNKGTNIHV